MEAPITPIQKLDAVLYILSVNSKIRDFGIQIDLRDKYNSEIGTAEIIRIVKRLQKDNFAEYDDESEYCIISFDGEVFLSQGGYTAKSLADDAKAEQQRLEIARLKSVDVSSDLNQKTLNILTGRLVRATWFAFGAAVALLAWQIYSTYNPPANSCDVLLKTTTQPKK